MKQQIRVRPGPCLDEVMAATGLDETPTQRLNTVAERYLALIEAVAPAFTDHELGLILDAVFDGGSENVSPSYWWQDVDERYGKLAPELVLRLQQLTIAEQIALAELGDRHWSTRVEET